MPNEKGGSGGCLCGDVRYRVTGEMRDVVACHCGQCRRGGGHHIAATQTRRDRLTVESAGALTRYESSPGIYRSFCARCGSNLFWEREAGPTVSIMAGTLDQPTGLKTIEHIFVADKGDYYEIADGLPQHARRQDS